MLKHACNLQRPRTSIRRNLEEERIIVGAVREHLQKHSQETLGVVAMNAKNRMCVFSSMKSGDILAEPNSSRGVCALREFLKFCEAGGKTSVLAQTACKTGRQLDSDFEVAVIEALRNEGFECVPQVGEAGFLLI